MKLRKIFRNIAIKKLNMNSQLSRGMRAQKKFNKSEKRKYHNLETDHSRAFLFFLAFLLYNCVFINQFGLFSLIRKQPSKLKNIGRKFAITIENTSYPTLLTVLLIEK